MEVGVHQVAATRNDPPATGAAEPLHLMGGEASGTRLTERHYPVSRVSDAPRRSQGIHPATLADQKTVRNPLWTTTPALWITQRACTR